MKDKIRAFILQCIYEKALDFFRGSEMGGAGHLEDLVYILNTKKQPAYFVAKQIDGIYFRMLEDYQYEKERQHIFASVKFTPGEPTETIQWAAKEMAVKLLVLFEESENVQPHTDLCLPQT